MHVLGLTYINSCCYNWNREGLKKKKKIIILIGYVSISILFFSH
jgi:hypothetical protein